MSKGAAILILDEAAETLRQITVEGIGDKIGGRVLATLQELLDSGVLARDENKHPLRFWSANTPYAPEFLPPESPPVGGWQMGDLKQ